MSLSMSSQISISEFPFVSELPKREKSKLRTLWEELEAMHAVVEQSGVPVPPSAAAELLAVSRQRIHELITDGKLDTVEFAGKRYVTQASLEAWAEAEHKTGRPMKQFETLGEVVKTAVKSGVAGYRESRSDLKSGKK